MFLDQSTSPAIIAHGISILYHEDILNIIYLLRDNSAETIMKVLKYYFPEVGNFELEEVKKLKKSANLSDQKEENVDYIIENQKVVIIDRTTGYKKPNSRWQNCVHEFVEIKEGIEVKKPQISTCSITQCTFFNMYKSITGLSGTLGNFKDEQILKKAYKINLFRVPRNLPSKIPIYHRERPSDPFDLYTILLEEILEISNNNRPVLVIFNTIKQVEEFFIVTNYDRNKCGIIQGTNPEEDRKSILIAGNNKQITIATAAAGRGMDIKLDNISLKNGGLHVIIPYCMENNRVLEQCIGRCGRQGQPGSSTLYVSDDDFYYETKDFDEKFENLLKLQNKFANYIKNNWKWLYDYNNYNSADVEYPFNISIENMIELTLNRIHKKKIDFCSSYYDMILKAWGIFYSRVEQNLDKYKTYAIMEKEFDKKFMKKLNFWIPEKCNSLNEAISNITKELQKKIDMGEILLAGLDIASLIISVCFPQFAPIVTIENIVIQNGRRIYKKLKNREKIN